MALKIFNTLSDDKEEFVPLTPGKVRMYVCGVTVYDSAHLGHCRFLLTFDVIYRYLLFRGYDVIYARNFTDVDDKIIKRAHDEQVDCATITDRYIAEFQSDSESLGLLAPTIEPRATQHIGEIIAIIEQLEQRGLAYRVDGDVFYSVAGFAGYGKLSRKKIDELAAGARVEVDERKRSPLDFALWKSSKPGEPIWDSPWGPGRPGWHIECSTMSTQILGPTIDVHSGGADLCFPHHECEIAQVEPISNNKPFVRFWMHVAMVYHGGAKMSKSLGNLVMVRDLLKTYPPDAMRLYLGGHHYRQSWSHDEGELAKAEQTAQTLREAVSAGGGGGKPVDASPDWAAFCAALSARETGARVRGAGAGPPLAGERTGPRYAGACP